MEVFVVYDPKRVPEPAGKTHWPLDSNVDVILSVGTASKDLNDLQVRSHCTRVGLSLPPPQLHPRWEPPVQGRGWGCMAAGRALCLRLVY